MDKALIQPKEMIRIASKGLEKKQEQRPQSPRKNNIKPAQKGDFKMQSVEEEKRACYKWLCVDAGV